MSAAPDIIAEAYRHCEQIVRAQDKDRFLASLFAPAERRPYLFALYAFALEIARVQALVQEPLAGTIRLQWWLEALGGLRAEEAAASPVMIALQDASRQTGVALTPLDRRRRSAPGRNCTASQRSRPYRPFCRWRRVCLAPMAIDHRCRECAAQAVTFIADDPQQGARWLRRVSRASRRLAGAGAAGVSARRAGAAAAATARRAAMAAADGALRARLVRLSEALIIRRRPPFRPRASARDRPARGR